MGTTPVYTHTHGVTITGTDPETDLDINTFADLAANHYSAKSGHRDRQIKGSDLHIQ